MKSIEVSARTIEEAISAGLAKLECSIADCKVEIVQEGAKGLFGVFGSKPATVRLTPLVFDEIRMDSLGIDLQSSLERDQSEKAYPPKPRKEKPAPEKKAAQPEKKAAEPSAKPAPSGNRQRGAKEQQAAEKPKNQEAIERFKSAPLPGQSAPVAKQQTAKPSRASKPREPREAPLLPEMHSFGEQAPIQPPATIEMHPSDTPAGVAQQFLLGVTQRMGVSVQVDVTVGEQGHLFATMYGDTLGILIGRRGETLDALQYLTSLQINKGSEDYTRITLDTENYRAKREDALVRLAARTANRAVKTGRKVSLEPMNPYERRILHASLQNNPEVSTHSEGDEPYRHVVIVPQK